MEKEEKRKIFWRNFGLIFFTAILEILAFLSASKTGSLFGWYWLSFVFAVPLFFFMSKERRLPYLLGGIFLYRLIFSIGTVYFVIDPFLFFFSILIFLGLPLIFYFIAKYHKNLAFLTLLILWPFFEFLEARYTFLPNFIMEIGNTLGSSSFLGLARWGGMAGLTTFCIIINLLFFFLVREVFKKEDRSGKIVSILAVSIFIILFSSFLISKNLLSQNSQKYQALSNIRKVALISDNGQLNKIFKKEKLNEAQLRKETAIVVNYIGQQLKNKTFDAVILPEGLIDVYYDESVDQEALEKFEIENDGVLIGAYRNLAINTNSNLITNITSRQAGKLYNTLLFFNSKGELENIFNKEFLTITGEYWPFEKWHPGYFDWARKINPAEFENYAIFDASKNLSRGFSKTVPVGGINLAPAICLEAHYPDLIKKRAEMGAGAIVDTSSSIWISLGLEKYLALTRNLKKIEAVWLKTPILTTGRKEDALLITPDGKEKGLFFNYTNDAISVFVAELRF